MITTWQRILVVTIGIIFGLIVGYICIKPHLESVSNPMTQNTNTKDVFEQYLNSNNNSVSTETNTVETNSEIEKQKNNNTVEE